MGPAIVILVYGEAINMSVQDQVPPGFGALESAHDIGHGGLRVYEFVG